MSTHGGQGKGLKLVDDQGNRYCGRCGRMYDGNGSHGPTYCEDRNADEIQEIWAVERELIWVEERAEYHDVESLKLWARVTELEAKLEGLLHTKVEAEL